MPLAGDALAIAAGLDGCIQCTDHFCLPAYNLSFNFENEISAKLRQNILPLL
jgi:hypothetical protein